ncbi:hypothetical protein [Poseidonibacter antarcticus]|uniref:hypothetical protein n=1 Tax=Poseidonibacter antarcticus TaxID=2478538 RepID=UPI000EF467BE|nr:hypothetical protein [Poseidonibacter antarcticus]
MSDRLHEIIAEIGVLHKELIDNNKIKDANEVFEYIEDLPSDIREHYLDLLLQYYFQENDLKNLKELLLVGAKFDMRFSDVKSAFLNIKQSGENVIEFMSDSIVFLKDNDLDENLNEMYNYYINNEDLQVNLEESIELIKRNRYVCAFCYQNEDKSYSKFFLNKNLLESLKRDLPYLLG